MTDFYGREGTLGVPKKHICPVRRYWWQALVLQLKRLRWSYRKLVLVVPIRSSVLFQAVGKDRTTYLYR